MSSAKKAELAIKSNTITIKPKDFTSFLNISTKFNGTGGSTKKIKNSNNIKFIHLDTTSLAIKKDKPVHKVDSTGIFRAME